MRYIIIISLFFVVNNAVSQCKIGNCENGTGTYDFGWCVYSGSFISGKPEGQGTMKYEDYTYEGTFKNGLEDGNGVITYKHGQKESVIYKAGTKLKQDEKIAASAWKELEGQSNECASGNCNTGFGTVVFPSGNKYIGNFVNRRKHGNGIFYFANGDQFKGVFKNDLKEEGTYQFNSGYTFSGSFLNDEFYNGAFNSPAGKIVILSNGKVIVPRTSEVEGTNTSASCLNKQTCPHCHGKAIESKPIEQKLSWSTKDSYSVDRYGNKNLTYAGQSGGGTYSIPNYVACGRCAGKGFICK